MTDTERLRRLYEENEGLRDMLNQVAWHLGLGDEVHYYSGDNYAACQLRVLDAIEGLTERESDVETVRSDAMEAWEWVREHGGLSHVKDIYHDLRAVVERLGIEWSESELHVLMDTLDRRLMPEGCDWEFLKLHMSNLRGFMLDVMDRLGVDKSDSDAPEIAFDALDRRLMPEGMEWLRYEDGELVEFGCEFANAKGNASTLRTVVIKDCRDALGGAVFWKLGKGECAVTLKNGERVRRPQVLAADGEPLEVGQTVWDADAESDTPLTVVEVSSDLIRCEYTWKDGKTYRPCYPPSVLTHTKPERQNARFGPRTVAAFHREIAGGDSWERIEEDIADLPCSDYCDIYRIDASDTSYEHAMARDIVRRCKALAERERGE